MKNYVRVLICCAICTTVIAKSKNSGAKDTTFTKEIIEKCTEYCNENVEYLSKKIEESIEHEKKKTKNDEYDTKTDALNKIKENVDKTTYEFLKSGEKLLEKLSKISSLQDVDEEIKSATKKLDKKLREKIEKILKEIAKLIKKTYGSDKEGLKKFKDTLKFMIVVLRNTVSKVSNSISISINNGRRNTNKNLDDCLSDIQKEFKKTSKIIQNNIKGEFMAMTLLFTGFDVFTNSEKMFETFSEYLQIQIKAIQLNLGYTLKDVIEEIVKEDEIKYVNISKPLLDTIKNSKDSILVTLEELEKQIKTFEDVENNMENCLSNLTEPDQESVNYILNGCYLIIKSSKSTKKYEEFKYCISYTKIAIKVAFELTNVKLLKVISDYDVRVTSDVELNKNKLIKIMYDVLEDILYVKIWATDYLNQAIRKLENTVFNKKDKNLNTTTIILNLSNLITDLVQYQVSDADNIVKTRISNNNSNPTCTDIEKTYNNIKNNIKVTKNQLETNIYNSLVTLQDSIPNENLININIKIQTAFQTLNTPLNKSFNKSLQDFSSEIITLDGVGKKGYKRFISVLNYIKIITENVMDIIIPAEFIKVNEVELKLLKKCKDGLNQEDLTGLNIDVKNATQKWMKLFNHQFTKANIFIEGIIKEYKDSRNVIHTNMGFVDRIHNGEKEKLVKDLSVYFYNILDDYENFDQTTFLTEVKTMVSSIEKTRSKMLDYVKNMLLQIKSMNDIYDVIDTNTENITDEYIKNTLKHIFKSIASIVISNNATTETYKNTIEIFFDLAYVGKSLSNERLLYAYTNLEISLQKVNYTKEYLEEQLKTYIASISYGFTWSSHYWKSGTGGLVNLTTSEYPKVRNYNVAIHELSNMWYEVLEHLSEEITSNLTSLFKSAKDTSLDFDSIQKKLEEIKSKPLEYLHNLRNKIEQAHDYISDLSEDLNNIFKEIDIAFESSDNKIIILIKAYLKKLAKEVIIISGPGSSGLKQYKNSVFYLLVTTKNILSAVKVTIATPVNKACYNIKGMLKSGSLTKKSFDEELSVAKCGIKEKLKKSPTIISDQFGVLFDYIEVLKENVHKVDVVNDMTMEFISNLLEKIKTQYMLLLNERKDIDIIKEELPKINQKDVILTALDKLITSIELNLDDIDNKIKEATKHMDHNKKYITQLLFKSYCMYVKSMDLSDQTSADFYRKLLKKLYSIIEITYHVLEMYVDANIHKYKCKNEDINMLKVHFSNTFGLVYHYIFGPVSGIVYLVTTKHNDKPTTKTYMETINYGLMKEYYTRLNHYQDKIIDKTITEVTANITFVQAVEIVQNMKISCIEKVNAFDNFLEYNFEYFTHNIGNKLTGIILKLEKNLEDTKTVLSILLQERLCYLAKKVILLEGIGSKASRSFAEIVLYTQKFMRYHNALIKMTLDQIFDGIFASMVQMNSNGQLNQKNVRGMLVYIKTVNSGAIQKLINKYDVQSKTFVDLFGIFIGKFENPENLTKTMNEFFKQLFNGMTKHILKSAKTTIQQILEKGVNKNTNFKVWYAETSQAINTSLITEFYNLETPAYTAITSYSNSLLLSIENTDTSLVTLSEPNRTPIEWLLKTLTTLCRAQINPGNEGMHMLQDLLYFYNKSLFFMHDLVVNKWIYVVATTNNDLLELIVQNKLNNETLNVVLNKIYGRINYQTDWSLSFAYDHFDSIVIEETKPKKMIEPKHIIQPMKELSKVIIENITISMNNYIDEIPPSDDANKIFHDLKTKNHELILKLVTIFNTKLDNLRLSIKGTLNNIYKNIDNTFGDFEKVIIQYKDSLTILADATINIYGTDDVIIYAKGWTSIDAIVRNILFSIQDDFDGKTNYAIVKAGVLHYDKSLTKEKLKEILNGLKKDDGLLENINEQFNIFQQFMNVVSLEIPNSKIVLEYTLNHISKYFNDITTNINDDINKTFKDYEFKQNISLVSEVDIKLQTIFAEKFEKTCSTSFTKLKSLKYYLPSSLEGIDHKITKNKLSPEKTLIDLSSITSSSSNAFDFLHIYKKTLESLHVGTNISCFVYHMKLDYVRSKVASEITNVIMNETLNNTESFSKVLEKIPKEIDYQNIWCTTYRENAGQTMGEISTVQKKKYFEPSDIIDSMPQISNVVVKHLMKKTDDLSDDSTIDDMITKIYDNRNYKDYNLSIELYGDLNLYYNKIPIGLKELHKDIYETLVPVIDQLAVKSIKTSGPHSNGVNLFTQAKNMYQYLIYNVIDVTVFLQIEILSHSKINIDRMTYNNSATQAYIHNETSQAKEKIKMLHCDLTERINQDIAALDLFIHYVVYYLPDSRMFSEVLLRYYKDLLTSQTLLIQNSVNITIYDIMNNKSRPKDFTLVDYVTDELNKCTTDRLKIETENILETLITFKNNMKETLDNIDYSIFSNLEEPMNKTVTNAIKRSVALVKSTKNKFYYGVNTLKQSIDALMLVTKVILNVFSTSLKPVILKATSDIADELSKKTLDEKKLYKILESIDIKTKSHWTMHYGGNLIEIIVNRTTAPIEPMYPTELFEYAFVIDAFLTKFNSGINDKVQKIITDSTPAEDEISFSKVKTILEQINTTCLNGIQSILVENKKTLEEIERQLNKTLVYAEDIIHKEISEVKEPTKTYLKEFLHLRLNQVIKIKGLGSNAVKFFKVTNNYTQTVLELSLFVVKNLLIKIVDNTYYNIGLKTNETTIPKSVLNKEFQRLQIIILNSLEKYKKSSVNLINEHKYTYSLLPGQIFYNELHVHNFLEFSKPTLDYISQGISENVLNIKETIDSQTLDTYLFVKLDQELQKAVDGPIVNGYKGVVTTTNRLKNVLGMTLDDVDKKIDLTLETVKNTTSKTLFKKEYISYSSFVINRKGKTSRGVLTLKTALFLMTQRMAQLFGIFQRSAEADYENTLASLTENIVNNDVTKDYIKNALDGLSKNIFDDGNQTKYHMGNMFSDMRDVTTYKDEPENHKMHVEL